MPDTPEKLSELTGSKHFNYWQHRAETAEAALERDRSAVAVAVSAIRKAIDGRAWLREPARGSYPYDDERYQEEFGAALDDIEAPLKALAVVARDWSNCPTDPKAIAAARSGLTAEARLQSAEKAMSRLLLLGDPGLEAFEELAEEFYKVTGYLRPGKSEPLEMYAGEEHEEERREAWRGWIAAECASAIAAARAHFAAHTGEGDA